MHVRADGDTARLALGQEESHVDVGQVDQVEQLAAGTQHLAGLRHAILHAGHAVGLQLAIGDIGLQSRNAGPGRLERGFGLDHLGFRRGDAGLGAEHLRAGGGQRGLGALLGGNVIVQLLAGHGVAFHQHRGALVALGGGGQLGLPLMDDRLGGGLFALAHGDQGAGGEDGVLRLAHLGLGLIELCLQHFGVHPRQYLPGLNEIAFVDVDLDHSAGQLGGHVDFGGLDPPVAAGEALAEAARAHFQPGQQRHDGEHGGDHQDPAQR